MRSNGLTASAYTPIADLEPQVADALLAELRVQGVAAYTKPVESSTTTGFDRPEFRVSVRDRLYVDTAASGQVRRLIALQGRDLDVDNEDLSWAQIVATFDQPVAPGPPAWPVQEDLDSSPQAPSASTDTSPVAPAPSGALQGDEDSAPSRRRRREDSGDVVDPGDHFVPAAPPPLPRLDPHKQMAWLGLAGGPLLLLIAALFTVALPQWLSLLAVAGFVGGFITLVATKDDASDEDWDSDDGAVV